MRLSDIFRTWRLTGGRIFGELAGGLLSRAASYGQVVTLTYGSSIAIDLSTGTYFLVTITNATAFALANPTNPPPTGFGGFFTVEFRNASGGAHGAGTFGTDYQVSAALAAIANGQNRTVGFVWTGTEAVEVFRTAADVPN